MGDLNQRFGGRTIAGLVLLILAIVLIGIATTLSWWNLSSSGGSSAWYLSNACSGGTSCQSYQGNPKLDDVFRLTDTLVLASLSLSVLTLVFFILSILLPRFGVALLITGVIGSVVLSVAAVYFYFGLPGALGSPVNSFFGSSTFFGAFTLTWGGGTGWFMAFVAAAFFFISTGIAFSAARQLAPLGNLRFVSRPVTTTRTDKTMFCPICGSHYPAGTQYCSRDATALKEMTQ